MIIRLFLLLLSLQGIAHAQLFSGIKEYRFVNDYNLALTAVKNSTTAPVSLQPLNYTDNNQVWVVEYNPSLCSTTGYYTVRSKGTGEYLTVLGYNESINSSNLRQTGYQIALTSLRKKGADDIATNQKWRFGNLDGIFALNGYFKSIYQAPFQGRTELVSLKNYVLDFCKVSSFSFDLTYKHNGSNLGIQTQLISGGVAPSFDNAKFKIIPNNPVTLVTIKDITLFRCPQVLLSGDREFGGQVAMNLSMSLELNPQRTAILMKVDFKAEEPKGDRSATRIFWTEKIYEAPLGVKIKSIVSNPSWALDFASNLTEQSFNQTPCEFLRYCEVIGDTLGDDISNDTNCNDDCRIGNFIFNKVAVIFD